MKVARNVVELQGAFPCFIATIGNYDGVHYGHRKIISRLIGAKRTRPTCGTLLITFEPHPASVLYPARNLSMLTSIEKKLELLEGQGLDAVLLLNFTLKFAQMDPRDFVSDAILPLNIRSLYIGHDFAFGRGRSGNADFLEREGKRFGFDVFEIAEVILDGGRVGSSRIRGLIENGEVKTASKMLERIHSIIGTVISGAGRGQKIGFPTCNLEWPEETVPGPGVYATWTLHNGRRYGSVTHIGTVPTFKVDSPSIETHIFNFNENIRGSRIEVFFVEKLRDTNRYESIDDLVRQIKVDCEETKRILDGSSIRDDRAESGKSSGMKI